MVERGEATAEDIDTAMKLGAGVPMGACFPSTALAVFELIKRSFALYTQALSSWQT